MNTNKILAILATLFPLLAISQTTLVYYNGDILTMEGDSPQYVEAVVVKGDKIAFAGALNEAMNRAGQNAQLQDLKGHTLLPGFIDTWGHFALVAQDTLAVNLAYFSQSPPKNRSQLIEKLQKQGQVFNGWIIGTGYTAALLSDGALALEDLDNAFPNQPVLIENISTLTGQVNTAGLKKLGISQSTKAVSGFITKDPKTGKLTGELIGMPYLDAVAKAVGKYSKDLTFETYRKAEKIYLSNGITTAQSYESTISDINNMHQAVDKGIVKLDLIALPTFDVVDQLLASNPHYPFGAYSQGSHGFKVAGIMVPTDGAPQLRLAYFSKPYADTSGFGKDWRGFPYYPQSLIDRYAKLAYDKNIQYFGYSNGDAGIDMTLSAINKASKEVGPKPDRRTVISHSMFVRDDQLNQYRDMDIMALLLSNHTWLYGDVYPAILGEPRAENINLLKTIIEKRVNFGIHSDAPSSGPSILFTLWSAVNRKTLSGKVLGPEQRIDPYLALKGVTANAAYQYREEQNKGTITAGKLADLVELDRNPLKVKPDEIKDIRVMQTIKAGNQLYSAGN
jgi:predicted amidohydrolase YtcJ